MQGPWPQPSSRLSRAGQWCSRLVCSPPGPGNSDERKRRQRQNCLWQKSGYSWWGEWGSEKMEDQPSSQARLDHLSPEAPILTGAWVSQCLQCRLEHVCSPGLPQHPELSSFCCWEHWKAPGALDLSGTSYCSLLPDCLLYLSDEHTTVPSTHWSACLSWHCDLVETHRTEDLERLWKTFLNKHLMPLPRDSRLGRNEAAKWQGLSGLLVSTFSQMGHF